MDGKLLVMIANEPAKFHSILVPKQIRREILRAYYDSPMAGHLGQRKTLQNVQSKYYWKGISKDVKTYVKSCASCNERKNAYREKLPESQCFKEATAPGERIHMDIVIYDTVDSH